MTITDSWLRALRGPHAMRQMRQAFDDELFVHLGRDRQRCGRCWFFTLFGKTQGARNDQS